MRLVLIAVFTDRCTVSTHPDLRLPAGYMSATESGGCCRIFFGVSQKIPPARSGLPGCGGGGGEGGLDQVADDRVEAGGSLVAEHGQAHAVVGEPGVEGAEAGLVAGVVEDPAAAGDGAGAGAGEPAVAVALGADEAVVVLDGHVGAEHCLPGGVGEYLAARQGAVPPGEVPHCGPDAPGAQVHGIQLE